jgi:ABC-type oligopeptide transport system substrate-binding subunit
LARSSRRNTVPIGFTGWHADFPDPSTFFEPTLSSTAIQDEESQNAAFFSNAEFDEILNRARRSTDRAERMRLYRRAEAIVVEEAPWATAYSYRYLELWQPYVHGYHPHPVLSQNVRDMWFDLDQRKQARSAAPCWGGLPGLEHRCGEHGARTTLALALGRPP